MLADPDRHPKHVSYPDVRGPQKILRPTRCDRKRNSVPQARKSASARISTATSGMAQSRRFDGRPATSDLHQQAEMLGLRRVQRRILVCSAYTLDRMNRVRFQSVFKYSRSAFFSGSLKLVPYS